jgi:hypothetical protein
MKVYYLVLPLLGIYFLYAAYKGYPSLLVHYFRFKSDQTNKGINKAHNACLGIAFFVVFMVLISQ